MNVELPSCGEELENATPKLFMALILLRICWTTEDFVSDVVEAGAGGQLK